MMVCILGTVLGLFLPAISWSRKKGFKYESESERKISTILIVAVLIIALLYVLNYFGMAQETFYVMLVWFCSITIFASMMGSLLHKNLSKVQLASAVVCALLILVCILTPYMSTSKLYAISNVEVSDNERPISIDTTHIRQVNLDYAEWKADKLIGNLGSKVTLGESEIVLYHGRLTWICPLIHRDYWKDNKYDTTPGYIMVDAEDPSLEAKMVDTFNIDISYQNEYFGDFARRIVYNDYPEYTQYWTFEIDESGNPWDIVTLAKPTVGWDGDEVETVLLLSPINRTIEKFTFGNQPWWVDNAFPEELTENYNKWWGKYPHGYWNSLFSETDCKQPTNSDVYMVVGNDQQTYWFMDFTSPSDGDNSMIGYMLTNTKTGEFKFYNANGMLNSDAAKEAVNAKISNYAGWNAKQPMFLMVGGNETWFTPIHSSTNILQKVALTRALDGNVTIGNNIADVLLKYNQNNDVSYSNITGDGDFVVGNITSIDSYVVNGNTEWYIEIFNGSSNVGLYAQPYVRPFLYSVGDSVNVTYTITDSAFEHNAMVASTITRV